MSSLFNFSFQPCMCVDSYWDRDWKILHFKFLSADSDLKQKERIKDTSENKYATDKNAIKDGFTDCHIYRSLVPGLDKDFTS